MSWHTLTLTVAITALWQTIYCTPITESILTNLELNSGIFTEENQSYKSKCEMKCEEYREIISNMNPGEDEILKKNCVRSNPLITSGSNAKIEQFPHMVSLGIRDENGNLIHLCGGTLISDSWVLTAAHCTYGPNGGPSVARLGTYDLKYENGLVIPVKRSLRHPSYKPPALYADVALVKLNETVEFSDKIKPACLYPEYDGLFYKAWITGWGSKEYGGDTINILQKARVSIVDNISCSLKYNASLEVPRGVTTSMLCAGNPQGGWKKDTCQGDSGGPLQIYEKKVCMIQVIGVTSFGTGCAFNDTPGVYTRISHFLDWIEDTVWPDQETR